MNQDTETVEYIVLSIFYFYLWFDKYEFLLSVIDEVDDLMWNVFSIICSKIYSHIFINYKKIFNLTPENLDKFDIYKTLYFTYFFQNFKVFFNDFIIYFDSVFLLLNIVILADDVLVILEDNYSYLSTNVFFFYVLKNR